jgi:predicted glycoside hydrolase/deacetylase ChbG (UPF0249 family)
MSFGPPPRGWNPLPAGASPRRARIVFHADDFGMNRAVTDGILSGFEHGVITATSLLANAPDAARALREWQRLQSAHAKGHLPSTAVRRRLDEPTARFELGVHLNLTQGRPLTAGYPSELLDDRGCFVGVGKLFATLYRRRPRLAPALLAELAAQVEFVCDHGEQPTHLNGHQYIELLPGLRPAVRELLARHQIPALRVAREPGLLRTTVLHEFRPANACVARVKRFYALRFASDTCRWNVARPDAYFGTSHAGRINLDLVRRYLQAARGCRLIEIGVHPGTAEEDESTNSPLTDGWADPLAALRPQELGLLSSPLLVELIERFGLSLGRLTDALSHPHALPLARAA